MNEEPISIAKQILSEIARAKDFSTTTDINEIFASAETIIGSLAFLTSPIVDAEIEYRKQIVYYINEGKSHAEAETRAKTSEAYKYWKKLEAVKDLANEQILLLKKFQTELGLEYKRS